jgi:hypothetical protein
MGISMLKCSAIIVKALKKTLKARISRDFTDTVTIPEEQYKTHV